MCTQYVHLGSNTLCNLTKKCIRAYAQKAAELKPTLAEFIEYHPEKLKISFSISRPNQIKIIIRQ